MSRARNGIDWDCVVSCEMIGSYKPNPEAYSTCARWLGFRPEEILMVACHNFDLLAARKAGYRSAFVRRPDEWGAAGPPDPDARSGARHRGRRFRPACRPAWLLTGETHVA